MNAVGIGLIWRQGSVNLASGYAARPRTPAIIAIAGEAASQIAPDQAGSSSSGADMSSRGGCAGDEVDSVMGTVNHDAAGFWQ